MNFILLVISSILAIIAATLKTEKDVGKSIIKKPNKAGWVVISLLLLAFVIQFIIAFNNKIESKLAETREKEKEEKIEFLILQSKRDSSNFKQQLSYLKESYEHEIDLLTNTDNILNGTSNLLKQSQDINSGLQESYDQILFIQNQDSINHQLNKNLSNEIFGSIKKTAVEQKDQFDSTITNLQIVEHRLSETTNNVERLIQKIDLNDIDIVVDLLVKFNQKNSKIQSLKQKLDSLNINMDMDHLKVISRQNGSFDLALNSEFNQHNVTGLITDKRIKNLLQEKIKLQMAVFTENNSNKPEYFNAWGNFENADIYSNFEFFSEETEVSYFSGKDLFHVKLIFPIIEIHDQNLGSVVSFSDLEKSTIWIGVDVGETLKRVELESVEKLQITLRNGQYLDFEKQKTAKEGTELVYKQN